MLCNFYEPFVVVPSLYKNLINICSRIFYKADRWQARRVKKVKKKNRKLTSDFLKWKLLKSVLAYTLKYFFKM